MGHIFISYSHKDAPYVHKLVDALKEEGFEVWIDDRIHYGSEWPKAVTSNLDISDGVIVVLSNNSYASDMVQNEVARAREKKKPIFTLLLDGDNWLIVQTKQFVDVRDESLPTEKFYKRLERVTQRKNIKAEREAAAKAAREKAEKETAEKERLAAEEKTRQKAAKEKAERNNTSAPKERTKDTLRRFLHPGYIGILIVLIVLLFGNNFYEQITGHSIFWGISTSTLTFTSTPKPSPTYTITVLSSTTTVVPITTVSPTLITKPTGTFTVTSPPASDQMNAFLVAPNLGGSATAPVSVSFDARDSSVRFADGSSETCRDTLLCSYVFTIRQGNEQIYTESSDGGRITYRFTRRGQYTVVVHVCYKTVCDDAFVPVEIK